MKLDFISQFTPRVGIDIGTTRTRIWTAQTGIAVDEATCLAVENHSGKVVAVGDEAAAMRGRVGKAVTITEPFHRGEMADSQLTRAFLQVLLQRIFSTTTFFRPLIMVSVPTGLSPAKRQLLVETLLSAGGKEVYTISQPLAAAIGAGVPIADASGTFLFHLGGGRVEAAVISLGSVVVSDDSPKAGLFIDQKLQLHVKKQEKMLVSRRTAEMLKSMVGSLDEAATLELMTSGQDVRRRSPREVQVTSQTLHPVMVQIATQYERLLKKVLSEVPPELTVDAIDKGLLLTGGLAQLNGLVEFCVKSIGVPAAVVDEPDKAVINGIATALEHLDEFTESLGYLGNEEFE